MTNLECHNFSTSFVCTAAHISVLANGVKFVPTPRTMSSTALQREIARFENTVRRVTTYDDGIFISYEGSNNNNGDVNNNNNNGNDDDRDNSGKKKKKTMPALYRPSGFVFDPLKSSASPLNRCTNDFIEAFKTRMETLARDRLCNPAWKKYARYSYDRPTTNLHLQRLNLTKAERAALADLRAATRFTYDPSTNTYTPPRIVDYPWFHSGCLRQLSDKRHYVEMKTEDALNRLRAAFANLTRYVDEIANTTDPKRRSRVARFLLSRPPHHEKHRTPSFYVIPKVHKPKLAGRPITPAQHYMLGPACDFITKILHPLVTLVPEILRDSTQLVLELDEIGEGRALQALYPYEEIYLVTGDVESLYPNIPRDLCLELLRQLPIPRFALELLRIVFLQALVRFDRNYYRQIEGFPMGIAPAPDVANLFMWLLLRRLGPPPAERLLYRRLIDDLFIVWRGPRDKLETYLESINRLHANIRITWTISDYSVSFLDLEIYKGGRFEDNDGRLAINVHQKQLNRYLFIPQLSFHTEAQHRAWIKAELLRFMRNTSSRTDFYNIRAKFVARLHARGFSRKLIKSACSNWNSNHDQRDETLSKHQKRQDAAYEKALELLDAYRVTPPTAEQSLRAKWLAWRQDLPLDKTSKSGTPWFAAESLLLSEDLRAAVRDAPPDHLFGLFTRDAPPLAFFLPLTRETAGLRWGDITLTLTNWDKYGAPRWRLKPILLVHRRPPSLGQLLRFSNPEHNKRELQPT